MPPPSSSRPLLLASNWGEAATNPPNLPASQGPTISGGTQPGSREAPSLPPTQSRLPSRAHAASPMGNSKSGSLSKEILEELQLNTKFTEEELSAWYQSFLKECPSGRITRQEFQTIYAKFFPEADPKAYAQHVFRSFDANSDGTLDFKEYVIALHMTSAGKSSQKLEWAFSLYDVDGNGTISKNEVLEIITVSVGLRSPAVAGGPQGGTGIGTPCFCRFHRGRGRRGRGVLGFVTQWL